MVSSVESVEPFDSVEASVEAVEPVDSAESVGRSLAVAWALAAEAGTPDTALANLGAGLGAKGLLPLADAGAGAAMLAVLAVDV